MTDDPLKLSERFGVELHPCPPDSIAGVAANITGGLQPINGLRHPAMGNTSGWYLWAGENLLLEDGFFQPWHVQHLETDCPEVIPYLVLPPGWRFLIADGYEDVWFDAALLTAIGPISLVQLE
jgi:hypothetical protein